MKFYEKLIILRKKALLSQEALAEKLDVTRQTVSKWELGQTKPDIDKLNEISKLFSVDINVLTNDEVTLGDEKKENVKKKKKDRTYILYIVIVILVLSISVLVYKVGFSIKDKYDTYKENGFSIEETEKTDKKFNNIMILSEAYPELKANTQFLKLYDNLSEIEDELSDARTSYNYAVTTYNNLVESVPSNIIAKIFAFSKKKFFEIEDKEKENNKLEF